MIDMVLTTAACVLFAAGVFVLPCVALYRAVRRNPR